MGGYDCWGGVGVSWGGGLRDLFLTIAMKRSGFDPAPPARPKLHVTVSPPAPRPPPPSQGFCSERVQGSRLASLGFRVSSLGFRASGLPVWGSGVQGFKGSQLIKV